MEKWIGFDADGFPGASAMSKETDHNFPTNSSRLVMLGDKRKHEITKFATVGMTGEVFRGPLVPAKNYIANEWLARSFSCRGVDPVPLLLPD